jgi:predicted DNA binding CopG/RHH family protein
MPKQPKQMTKKQIEEEAAYANQLWRDRDKINQLAIDIMTGKSQPVTIRLDARDVDKAKRQAARKGMRYQTYIKSLLHEALESAR